MSGASYLWPAGFRSAACFTLDLDAHAPYLWTHRQRMPPSSPTWSSAASARASASTASSICSTASA